MQVLNRCLVRGQPSTLEQRDIRRIASPSHAGRHTGHGKTPLRRVLAVPFLPLATCLIGWLTMFVCLRHVVGSRAPDETVRAYFGSIHVKTPFRSSRRVPFASYHLPRDRGWSLHVVGPDKLPTCFYRPSASMSALHTTARLLLRHSSCCGITFSIPRSK